MGKNIQFLDPKNSGTSNQYTLEQAQIFIENKIDNLLRNTIEVSLYQDDYQKQIDRRKRLIGVSKKCGLGDLGAKEYMQAFILDLLTQSYKVNESNIDLLLNFKHPSNVQDMFDILLYKYKKEFQFNAFNKIVSKYNLDLLKERENGDLQYFISSEEIKSIFLKETINLNFEDKLNIITQKIYQSYKGLGVIDEIRDQIIDGLSLGVSGVPEDFAAKLVDMDAKSDNFDIKKYKMSYESIWLYYKGKEISLDFMSFGSQRELERICKIIYKFNNSKQFSKSTGYIFNTMADLSRVAVFRPPFSEKWCAFIRKYDITYDLDTLINNANSDAVISLLDFLSKSKQNIAITGQQGAGKTTLLLALIKQMYANTTLRVWEDFFESYLSIRFPNRNTIAIKNTDTIKGVRGIDALKKTNGQVTIISEVAEDEVIQYIVKIALTASECVMFTHHANNKDELVEAFRNGCISTGGFTDENIAEKQVLRVLCWNIHLGITPYGKRYIQRITEYIRVDTETFSDAYKYEKDINKKLDVFFDNVNLYFEKVTQAKKYKAIDLVTFDLKTNKYIFKNNISQERQTAIYNRLMKSDQVKFEELIKNIDNLIKANKSMNIC